MGINAKTQSWLHYLTEYRSQGVIRIILMVISHGRHSSGWAQKEHGDNLLENYLFSLTIR